MNNIYDHDNVYKNVYEEDFFSYDNVFVLKGNLTEEQAKKEIENIKKYFKNTKVYEKENDKNGYLGLKKLAYTIRGNEYGHYYVTHFKANPEEISKIEMNLRLNDDVIKFITVRTED